MNLGKHFRKFLPLFLISFLVLFFFGALIYYFSPGSKYALQESSTQASPQAQQVKHQSPNLSGWVAWWAEEKAYQMIEDNPGKITTASPTWFTINNDNNLELVGKVDKNQTVKMLKKNNVRILPTLGSELSGEKLSSLLRNNTKVNLVIDNIGTQSSNLGVDGVDVDLEGIKKEDRSYFTLFLYKLQRKLKSQNMVMSVTVHAQTNKVVWEGVEGQDLDWIGKNVDEVRIMTYDEHSADTKPGSVASNDWIKDVIKYNSKFMDKSKMVIGIPSYGYVWTKDETRGLQFDEFNEFLKGKTYKQTRDKKSGELVYTNQDFTGWLSDSVAMKSKILTAQNLGVNKFVIWHLGGMDEKVFDKN